MNGIRVGSRLISYWKHLPPSDSFHIGQGCAITILLVAMVSFSWAGTINTSKSNTFRVTYDTSVVSPAQASALLVELEKLGPADEAKLKMWLSANFKRLGIQGDRIKKISIRTVDKTSRTVDKASPILILLLANPADEAQALAVSDDGGSQCAKFPKSCSTK